VYQKFGRPLAVGVFLAVASAAEAQQSPAPVEASESLADNVLEEVIVTGTRHPGRTVLDSAAPIDVLSGSDLAAQSTANLLDTLSNTVPSFIVGQNAISDASSFVRSPSLRGLPGDEMLVMLNGKRFNRSALVQVYQGGETELSFGSQAPDLGSIPSIAVHTLEILRDGASAQYGSDAIAGVLNYHFRENSDGFELSARAGEYLTGTYPRDGADEQVAFNVGLPLGGSGGFANVSAEWAQNEQTNRGVTRASALAFAAAYPELAAQLPHYPGPVQQWGTPPSSSVKTLLNAGLPLNGGDRLYLLVNYAHIQSNESFNYRLPVDVTDAQGNRFTRNAVFDPIYLDPCTASLSGCPAGGFIRDANTFNFQSYYPAGFTPRFYGTTEELFATLGYKGRASNGLTYDVSFSDGRNSLALGLRGTLNPSLGPTSPRSFDDGRFVQSESTFSLDLTYPWTVPGFAAPVSVAGGLEWHRENFQQQLGDAASYATGPYAYQPLYDCTGSVCTPALDATGAQVIATKSTASNGYGGIGTPVDASMRNVAAYLDVEADLGSRATVGVAGRYENYSTFGSTTLGKLQLRYRLLDAVTFRATVSNGFHAPTAGQANVETVSTTFVSGGQQIEIGTYPVTSPAARHFGAGTIRPETSTNLSAGFVIQPRPDLTLTIDGYQIDVRDRISISQGYTVTLQDIQQQPALSYVGLGGVVQYFTNGFDTRTQGVDVLLTHKLRFESGADLSTTLAYNYNLTRVTRYDAAVLPDYRIVDIEHYAPNDRINLNLAYRHGRFEAMLHENYYGSTRDEFDYPGQVFSPKTTTDLDVSYEIRHGVTFAIGARNLFNVFPDKIANNPAAGTVVYNPPGGLYDGEVYPRAGGPFGFNGRFVYGRLTAKF